MCVSTMTRNTPAGGCSTDRTFEGRNVSCGATITRSIYVPNDQATCSGAGLRIGADDIRASTG